MTASISFGLPGAPGQNNGVLLQPLLLVGTTRGVSGFAALLQQNMIAQKDLEDNMLDITQAFVSYVMCSPQVSTSSSELSLPPILYVGVHFLL